MKKVIIFFSTLLFYLSMQGQCPGRDFLWHRIIFLRDSSETPPDKQLTELLNYENEINKCKFTNDSTYALLLQRIGWLFTTRNNFENAILYTKKSIKVIDGQKNNPAINPALAIKSYWNLSLMYDSLKLETNKIETYDSCLSRAIILQTGYEYALAAIKFLVPIYFNKGDYFRCVSYAELGENIINKTSVSSIEKENQSIQYFTWKINALIILKRTKEAMNQLRNKIDFAENHKMNNLLGTLYGLYASGLRDEGKPLKAIDYFKKCFHFFLLINFKRGCAAALNSIGVVYFTKLPDDKKALQYYLKALKYAGNIESLSIYNNIANIYARAGDYDSSGIYFQKAFSQLGKGFTEKDLLKKNSPGYDNEITEYIILALLDKGATYLKNYEATGSQPALTNAINIYEITDHYFDKIKASQSDILSKLFLKSNNRRLYEQAIEACWESHNYQKAFYFFEKSRAVLLNDQINEQRWIADTDISKQAVLKRKIIELDNKLNTTAPASDEYLSIQKDLYIKNQQLDALTNYIKNKNPLYYKNYLDTSFITISQLRKNILSNSKALMEIFSGDSAVYVLTITNSNQSLSKINKHLYDSLTNSYMSFISNRYLLNQHFKDFIKVSHQLYTLLFQKITPFYGSIIISPDGANYPFEALVLNEDTHHPDYFLNHYATSYTYSAKYLTNPFTSNTSAKTNVLGIAPVKYNNYLNLSTLSGSGESLKMINSYFSNATSFILGKATKNNFIQNFPDYKIIQLYTHASSGSINNDPVIYFSDSALFLSNLIPDLKPVTQLVILSACETASGKFYQGEGIFSFNRGFAALGIPAAISNLWSVDNESTYRITELFYKYLSKGLPTDVALQKAKLEFINNASSMEEKLPYFWAGPVLTGKVDILQSPHSIPWLQIGMTIIVLLFMGYFLKRMVLKKSVNKPCLPAGR